MNIVFRVDSSVEIGSGHVARCMTLAHELVRNGYSILFICRDTDGNMAETISKNGFECALLCYRSRESAITGPYDWSDQQIDADVRETKNILSKLASVSLLVVDHYGIDVRWTRQVRSLCNKILVIDDLADREHECDFLLDQTFNRRAEDYRDKVSESCTLMLGSQFALLRPEFSSYRKEAIARRTLVDKPKRVLVSMGGTDPLRMTEKVMDALSNIKSVKELKVDVVLSSKAPNIESVQALSKTVAYSCEVHIDSSDMALLMANADLSVGAGGTTSWERCCVGLPSLTIQTANNQSNVLNALSDAGAIKNIDTSEQNFFEYLTDTIAEYIDNPKKLREMSLISLEVCDGFGVERCVTTLVE